MDKLKVTYRKVEDLIPYARNARMHTEDQIVRLASSIKEFGFTNPILTDGENGVIAGHGRLQAAKKLGLAEVPTIELSGLSENQKKAYILADNRLSLDSYWDAEMLHLELDELTEKGFNIELTGFTPDEIESIPTGEIDEGFFNDVQGDGSLTLYSVTLNFPIEYEEQIKEFVRKVGREVIADKVLQWMKEGAV